MQYLRSFSIYAFTLFFNAALSFATFSILTHHLNAVDYGVINLYSASIILLTPFIAVGGQFVLSVDYFKMDEKAYRKYFTNALAIPALACICFTVVAFAFYPVIASLLQINLLFAVILPLSCFLVVLIEVALNLFRNKAQHALFGLFSIFKNTLEIGLTLLLIVVLGYGWQGRLGSSFIILIAAGVFIAILFRKWRLYSGPLDKRMIYSIFIAGLPFIPERLAIFVLGYSDRFFIEHFNGTAEVGYYSAGAQMALIVNLVILTLNNTFYPVLFKSLSESKMDYRKIRNIVLFFIGISFIIAVGVILAMPLIFKYFIGHHFQQGKIYGVFLTIGALFWGVYNVFIAFLLNLKKNRSIMAISMFGMAVSLIANYINVQHFGPIGAAYSSIIVYFLMAVVTVYFVHKFYNLRVVFSS